MAIKKLRGYLALGATLLLAVSVIFLVYYNYDQSIYYQSDVAYEGSTRRDETNSGDGNKPIGNINNNYVGIANITSSSVGRKLLPPEKGIYHGAFPDFGPREDTVTTERIKSFEELVGKEIVWGYFSDNWFNGINFPEEKVRILNENGKVPFIRMMPRSRFQAGGEDPVYTLQKIIDGAFDEDLRRWARNARDTDIPLLIEFGTEVNGNWFTWSGFWNGGGASNAYGNPSEPDGPERFRDAYRHIIDLFRSEGAHDITWFFHVNLSSAPNIYWNKPHMYYPGDDYIDWIGVSVYGAQYEYDSWNLLSRVMDRHFSDIREISTNKPVAILEFGTVDRSGRDKGAWMTDALRTMIEQDGRNIKAISYWHSRWTNANGSVSDMRIDSSAGSLSQYRSLVQDPIFVTSPIFSN